MGHRTTSDTHMGAPDVDYALVCGASLSEIEQAIRTHLDQGWHSCGGVAGGDGAYYQTMVRFLH